MSDPNSHRKLSAILCADVAGYSRLMGVDEVGTHQRLMAARDVFERAVAERGGRVVDTAGDSVLADFPSVVDALGAAIAAQRTLGERNRDLPAERRLEFRIGINLGDVIAQGDDIFGDGVNVAARLQELATPGGICVSAKVYEEVKHKLDLGFRDRGNHRAKNIAEPIHVFAVELDGVAADAAPSRRAGAAVAALAGMATLAAVAIWVVAPGESPRVDRASSSAEHASGANLRARPTIAVLPFENQGDDAGSYFSDGVTQDIIDALGRFSNLRLMSWDAVSHYGADGDGAPALGDVAAALGVRYVVRGSIRRDAGRVRVGVRLTDAEDGNHLWSESYDSELDDLFAVQEEITQGVAGALAVQLTAVEQRRATAKPTDNLDAYDYVLRGRQQFRRENRRANLAARELFQKALELAPRYADAHVGLGWTYHHDAAYGWTERADRSIGRAHERAQEAIRLDGTNASAHTLLSTVHVYRRRHDLGLAEIDRAIELNPSHAEAHAWRGWILLTLGRTEQSIASSELAQRFNPSSPPSWVGNLGWAYFLVGRYEDAITSLESSMGRHPDVLFGRAALAATYAAAGRDSEATRAAARVKGLDPFFEAEPFGELFLDGDDRARVVAALHRAGLD